MHRHRKLLRIARTSCSSSRSAATSARVKPRDIDHETSQSQSSDMGMWHNSGQSSKSRLLRPGSDSTQRTTPPASLQSQPPSAAGQNKWARASPPHLTINNNPVNSPSMNNKWARDPPPHFANNDNPAKRPSYSSSSGPSFRRTSDRWSGSSPNYSRQNTSPNPFDTLARIDNRRQRDSAHAHHEPRSFGSRDSVWSRKDAPSNYQSRATEQRLNSKTVPDSLAPAEQAIPKKVFENGKDQNYSYSRQSDEGMSRQSYREDREHSKPQSRLERNSRAAYKERGTLLSGGQKHDTRHEGEDSLHKVVKKIKKPVTIVEKKVSADIYIPSTVSVGTLARLLGVRLERLQRKMKQAGMSDQAQYDHVLTSEYAVLLAGEFGRNPIVNDEAAFDLYPPPQHPDQSSLPSRPPVVTIMGHVDHGKTTLLDNLRSTSVAKGEAGGITQHIGAFSVPVPAISGNSDGPRSITFLDTPGHAAFSAMRARGARVTDVVVLVVAADDGIMPQTKEVISLIKKDQDVGVVVAINKVDKPEADVDSVKLALLAEDVQLEEFGGEIPVVEVSGLTGHGLPSLMETLSAISEMQDLRAEKDGPIHGYVLESKVHKGLGPVATVLVLRGCLKPGAHIISGMSQAKVRIMNDAAGAVVKAAYPGMAITVSGWKTVPNAGDEVLQGTETDVKKALANRQRKAEIEATLVDVEAINAARRQEREKREIELEVGESLDQTTSEAQDGPKELRLIVKADVSGSAEAVEGALHGIGNKEAISRIISAGVGDVSESDVMMAKTVGAAIIAFSVKTPRAIETLAAQNEVPIISSNIIYRLMELVKERVIALLPVIIETKVTGEAVILQLFDIHLKAKQTKKVAGCRVTNGIIEKSKFARLVRKNETIHDGSLDTMRILKKDVTEVRKGTECGLCFGPTFGDLQEGDMIQMYERIERPGEL